jgi:hypothetical protein
LDLTEPALLEQLGTSHEEKTRGAIDTDPRIGRGLLPQRPHFDDQSTERSKSVGLLRRHFPESMFEVEYVRVRDDSGILYAELLGQVLSSRLR